MRCQIIAECASNHGGEWGAIEQMIAAAAKHGADYVKFQAYQTRYLSTTDPQYDWLARAELTDEMITRIVTHAESAKIIPLFTVFHAYRVAELRCLGVRHFKLGHGDSHRLANLVEPGWFVSLAWGRRGQLRLPVEAHTLATVPLYPAPLHALAALRPCDGYSDHTVGLDACRIMIARGARFVEKHFSLDRTPTNAWVPSPRRQEWDMHSAQLRELRYWTEQVAEVDAGTPNTERWTCGG